MKRFKFRAECLTDVTRLMKKIGYPGLEIHVKLDRFGFPDVEVILDFTNVVSHVTQQDIISDMKEVEDSHVMIQTLEPEEFYTGERDTERPFL